MVLVVVKPEDHGRVPGHLRQQVPEAVHAVFTKQLYLDKHFRTVVQFGVAGGEDVMPEKSHLLLERALRVDHLPNEVRLPHYDHTTREKAGGRMAVEKVFVCGKEPILLGIQQLFHSRLVPLGDTGLHFGPWRSKASAPHHVGHQRDVVRIRHLRCLPSLCPRRNVVLGFCANIIQHGRPPVPPTPGDELACTPAPSICGGPRATHREILFSLSALAYYCACGLPAVSVEW